MLNYCLQECCQTFQEHDHALRYASFLTLRRRRLAGPAMKLPALRRLLLPLLLGGVLQPALPAHAAAAEDAPPLLLAQNFTDAVDPAAYLVSEKLDGVRALWDGRVLRFRSGRVIAAPDWFVAGLPAHPLDGELWMGRRNFDRLSAAVRRQSADDAEWRSISYQVYEWPQAPGTFSQRLAALQASVAHANPGWLHVVWQERIADRRAPPPVGSVVTYRYRERTPNGLPRFASFMRVRAPE